MDRHPNPLIVLLSLVSIIVFNFLQPLLIISHHVHKHVKMEKGIITLKKGTYLAPEYNIVRLGDLLVCVTEYKTPVKTGQWHAHENPLISFVLTGGNIERRSGREFERTPGSSNFYHAFESHRNHYTKFPSKHISVEIGRKFLDQNSLSEAEIDIAISNNHLKEFSFVKIYSEVLKYDSSTRISVEMSLLELINNSLSTKRPSGFPEWMKTVRDFLNDNWNENVSLQELAKEANVHPITISKHFKRYFSCTLGEYIRRIKIDKAIDLLRTSDISLTDISYTCGFFDQSHFSRVFKQQTGFLPKSYRKL